MSTRSFLLCTAFAAVFGVSSEAQVAQTVPYDHIHLTAPDPEKAYAWYVEHLGGQAGENPGRVAFGPVVSRQPLPVHVMFAKAPDAPSSEGGVIDSIGLSFADVAAKVKALEAAGATVIEPARDGAGPWKRAVVVDPWGTKIELVEDRESLGFHHISLRVADPQAATRWFQSAFGGERVKAGGRIDALRYGTTYLFVLEGKGSAPSQGRAIDHLGWGPANMDATAADLRAKNVTFASEPGPKPNVLGHRTAYVEAPGGVRIELVEHAMCAWGKDRE